MVTVTNVIANSAKIASNKPYLVDKIIAELLKTQSLHTTPHLTEECKLVIAQHAIETFNTLICYTQNKQPLIDYTKNHQNSIRISLKKEANSFLNKWQ
jgi:adenylate kinase family enzyme